MTLWVWVLIARGYRSRRAGRLADARRHFTKGVAAGRRAGNSLALVRALKGQGQIERDLGRRDDALPLYEEAVRICRNEGDTLRLAHAVRWRTAKKKEPGVVMVKANFAGIGFLLAAVLFVIAWIIPTFAGRFP